LSQLYPVPTTIDDYSLYLSTKIIILSFALLYKLAYITVYKTLITLYDTTTLLTPLPGPNIPVMSLFLSTFVVGDEKIPGVSSP